jgi:hypothetical protein
MSGFNLLFLLNFQSWHGLCNTDNTIYEPDGGSAITNEWRLNMQGNVTRIIATIVVSTLFAAGAAVAEDKDTDVEATAATTSDTAELNRNRAKSANNAAVEDAVEAVLAANKLHLDIRLIGRTSVQMADSR